MKVGIIGGGPSGLMCACICSLNNKNQVTIFDSNDRLGKKLYITGNGRCNVTNFTDTNNFLKNVVRNSKFLYSAINMFSSQDTINFFTTNNTPLKIENRGRVFPKSDKSNDIIKTFEKILNKNKVQIKLNSKITTIKKEDDLYIVKTNDCFYKFDALVLATGGKSYPFTGSTGDGYKFASFFNHKIIDPIPALVPIFLKNYDGKLAGVSLKDVKISLQVNQKTISSECQEILFTHFGVSGPSIINLSSLINRLDLSNSKLVIDLKPNQDFKQLDNMLIKDFERFKIKNIKNYMKTLIPFSLVEEFLRMCYIDNNLRLCDLTKEKRHAIVSLLKNFSYDIKGLGGFKEAFVTSGGVDVKEVNPKTMESKLSKNLFIVGELLDIDALTGGFNIQIALSTGFSAGQFINSF